MGKTRRLKKGKNTNAEGNENKKNKKKTGKRNNKNAKGKNKKKKANRQKKSKTTKKEKKSRRKNKLRNKNKKNLSVARQGPAGGDWSSCGTSGVNDTCLINAVNSLNFEKNQIQNFFKQKARLENQDKVTGNKKGKKG